MGTVWHPPSGATRPTSRGLTTPFLGSSARKIPIREIRREQVARGVEQHGGADAGGSRAQPAKDERREEDAEPRRIRGGGEVTEREHGAAQEQADADARSEHRHTPFGSVIEGRLSVA